MLASSNTGSSGYASSVATAQMSALQHTAARPAGAASRRPSACRPWHARRCRARAPAARSGSRRGRCRARPPPRPAWCASGGSQRPVSRPSTTRDRLCSCAYLTMACGSESPASVAVVGAGVLRQLEHPQHPLTRRVGQALQLRRLDVDAVPRHVELAGQARRAAHQLLRALVGADAQQQRLARLPHRCHRLRAPVLAASRRRRGRRCGAAPVRATR